MVIRFDPVCPRCGKTDVVGGAKFCHSCLVEGFYKSRIKQHRKEKAMVDGLKALKPQIRKELHDKLLKQILEEEKKND